MLARGTFLTAALGLPAAAAIPAAAWNRPDAERRRALVLSGGAARGAYEAGVVVGLLDAGYGFDLICGTSTGAINAALAAQGDLAALTALWGSVADRNLFVPKPPLAQLHAAAMTLMQRHGVFNRPLAFLRFLRELGRAYRSGDVQQMLGVFESAPISAALSGVLSLERVRTAFACGVTNLDLAAPEAFVVDPNGTLDVVASQNYPLHRLVPRKRSDGSRYVDAIRASSAFPFMLDPIAIASEAGGAAYSYIDGGVADNTPLALAHRLGATEIVAVFVDRLRTAPRRPRNVADIFTSVQIANHSQLDHVQAAFVAERRSFVSPARVYAIRPDDDLSLGSYDFGDQAALNGAFARGRNDGQRGPLAFSSAGARAT
ncbi:MAG: patatin-like phospholipase family protein [Candidatus Eremiobacteraeota bacterium]|nr:patatin-like phospholipase family protein [Candidatus Eremiobacteraeota bacterium]MBC5801513.1 patatin-like phospholipase family protein [Candidatus Eremiobacteraeota bacterium]MBC5821094.1 patatin-like phospholipase family protein [Candidatus Eremiobacteraeota bacterium]